MLLGRTIPFCAFVLAAIGPVSIAAAQTPLSTDEQLEAFGSREFVLGSVVNEALFADESIRQELMRVGLEQGCLLADSARRQAIERHWLAFRAHLVAAIRAVVPREHLMPPAIPIGLSGNGDLGRVRRQLDRTASELYALAIRDARHALVAELASAPSVPAVESAGRFSDWRFDRPLATQIACSLIASHGRRSDEELRRVKRVFDGFYRRQGEN